MIFSSHHLNWEFWKRRSKIITKNFGPTSHRIHCSTGFGRRLAKNLESLKVTKCLGSHSHGFNWKGMGQSLHSTQFWDIQQWMGDCWLQEVQEWAETARPRTSLRSGADAVSSSFTGNIDEMKLPTFLQVNLNWSLQIFGIVLNPIF